MNRKPQAILFKNAGTYVITISAPTTTNYLATETTATLTINKATYNMSTVFFNDDSRVYTGAVQALAISGTLPGQPGEITVTYENNENIIVGEYIVTAKFNGDANNYNPISDMEATLTITKATYNMSA